MLNHASFVYCQRLLPNDAPSATMSSQDPNHCRHYFAQPDGTENRTTRANDTVLREKRMTFPCRPPHAFRFLVLVCYHASCPYIRIVCESAQVGRISDHSVYQPRDNTSSMHTTQRRTNDLVRSQVANLRRKRHRTRPSRKQDQTKPVEVQDSLLCRGVDNIYDTQSCTHTHIHREPERDTYVTQ